MAWNAFKFCTALRALGSIMIVFVIGIIGVTYYSVVVAICGPAFFHGGIETVLSLVVLFFFHFLLVMLLCSYFSVVLTDWGGVPLNWGPLRDEEIADTDPLVVVSGYGEPELVPTPSPVVQVFGTDKKFWFFPAYLREDLRRIPALQGFVYPIRPDLYPLQKL